jgi:hypothetical protein
VNRLLLGNPSSSIRRTCPSGGLDGDPINTLRGELLDGFIAQQLMQTAFWTYQKR